ncbi:hypothetical protein ACFFTM_09885 [Pseudoduganella plicata]|uniref:Uncharacterized protein n=1 Tax=Pseudoduganella plicata TaxID=321984 RepID=A0A4P7BBD1_9BURK|nr:hypothetical protein [Pseudoduganella plicata]QBQ35137.1 hypothetical protein E1742_02335 [Pseudoduganella plicata]GGZ05604.1 hypothetical protein GCM10007388_44170 [Pseudoduganella plicata]
MRASLLFAVLVHIVLGCCEAAAGAPSSHLVTFDVKGRGTICVNAPGAPKLATPCPKRYGPAQQDRPLARAMRGADETTVVLHYQDDGKSYLVFLVSVPSNPAQRASHCGAGYEDSLVSARIHGGTLHLTDRLLFQSCLASLTLDRGRPDNVVKALMVDSECRQISFRREFAAQDTVIRLRSGTFEEAPTP